MRNSSKLTSIHNTLKWGTETLESHRINTARLDCLVLLSHALATDKAWILANLDLILTTRQQSIFASLINKRTKNIPVAYLLKHKEFYGRNFMVNKEVLVPRPETEAMVELALCLPQSSKQNIIDIGTGSGAIAISLALEHPHWNIYASDISKSALTMAKKNAARFHILDRITFRNQDLLTSDNSDYDVIFANLPYVPDNLHNKSDLIHEPRIALFAGTDGLNAYRRFFDQIGLRTNKPRYIFTESLLKQQKQLSKIAELNSYKPIEHLGLIQQFEYVV